jgi:predicted RNA-binding Zn-ribbon protein involved in translation (DUF1610 family)
VEIGILAWLVFGIVSAFVARKKGRSGCGWFFLGVLLGPFGLLLAFSVSSRKAPAVAPAEARPMKKCPSCGEQLIPQEAARCVNCEERASRPRTTSPGLSAEFWTCPRCGASNSKKLYVCSNCGYSQE